MDVPEFAAPEQELPEDKHGGIASHPYVLTLAGTALLVLIGMAFVLGHASTPVSQDNLQAWGGTGSLPSVRYTQEPNAQQQNAAAAPQGNMATSTNLDITLSPDTIQTLTTDQSAADVAAADLDALLAQISNPAKASTSVSVSGKNSAVTDAYAFIPTGLVATTSMSQASLNKTQGALYQYGNDAGAVIQTYEYTHQNVAQILKDQASDRSDPDKAASVKAIGKALAGVGTALLKISDVPASIASYNSALGKSYQDIGAKLALVAQAGTDDQFLTAVQNYNASADIYTKNYIALATYLSASGVTFSPDDSGSVFSFKPVTF